jgi:phospholipid/cholesterol/gamma-HCH transport system ATP-binding protein
MLEIKSLSKKFGARQVLKSLDLKIHRGEIVFILGTSGTGKSVLLKLIVGLLQASSGEIWVDGQNIIGLSEEELGPVRKKCGMVFQHPALFDSLTVFENVAFGLRRLTTLNELEITQRVRRCLELVHLSDIEKMRPQEISYGMQKRVSLARTIATAPEILLFDEPTTGLDPITTNAINQLIRELSRELKTTSVVVSHDMQCAIEIADRIIVLDGGQIVASGTPDEIRHSTVPLVKDFMAEVNSTALDRGPE